MKILIISHMYPSKNKRINGVFVHEQVKELIKKGHQVKVISPVPYVPSLFRKVSSKWNNYNAIPNKEILEGIEVYHPRYVAIPRNVYFHTSGNRMFRGLKNIVNQIYNDFKFDIIHAHVALPDGFAAMKLAHRFNVPLVTTVHGQDLQHTIFKNAKCKKIIIKVLNESNRNILVSNKLLNLIDMHLPQVNKQKCVVINNGISELFLKKEIIRKSDNKVRILSVSNLLITKGIDLNLYAISSIVKLHPDVTYQVIGDGEEKERLEKLVEELHLQNNVTFLGWQSREQVHRFMSSADIFLLPSWNEAFGVVYIEAMATGLPVIGCKGEGIEDIVEKDINGCLVNPMDIEDIVKKVKYLIDNPENREIMGKKALEKIERNFTWKVISTEISQVYQEALIKDDPKS